MALINRISRLFKADFHAVLDQIEEPEVLLKQAIRDMEDELANTEHQISLCVHDQQVLTQRKGELARETADFDLQIDLCFESGKDELVRNVIRKKIETERLSKRLTTKLSAVEERLAYQQNLLEQNGATLESMLQKSELFMQRAPGCNDNHSEFDDITRMSRDLAVDDDEVEIAYLREKDARSAS